MNPIAVTSPTVWVHVSTLMKWQGPPVGVVRTEREYCRWALAQQRAGAQWQLRFCACDLDRRSFYEVSADQVQERLARMTWDDPVPFALPAWKMRIKALGRAVAAYLPQRMASGLSRTARTLWRGQRELRSRLKMRLASLRAGPHPEGPPPAAFGRGDAWLSLGGDWAYLDQEALYRAKLRHGLRVTLICYDTIPVLRPQLFVSVLTTSGFAAYLADIAWCADAVLCISECTRRDFHQVLQTLQAPQPPTHVIRLGSEIHRNDPAADEPPAGLGHEQDSRPFVLFVSTIERRKNHDVLYRAWARLREQGRTPYRLVFVGMLGWGVGDLMNDIRLDPRVARDIVILNRVTDAQLAWLYRHCAFTVFPSLYEGWGLPVVESLAWGKFCLSSNAASLPEAGEGWAEYLDPWDLPAWVERLGYYMEHSEEVAARNARIAREFRPTPWSEACEAMHEVILGQATKEAP